MKYLVFVSWGLLTSFSYTMNKSPYSYRFHRDPDSGSMAVICKTRKNKCVGIITKDHGVTRLSCDVSEENKQVREILDYLITKQLEETLTELEKAYKN